jgi:hypothetical protein
VGDSKWIEFESRTLLRILILALIALITTPANILALRICSHPAYQATTKVISEKTILFSLQSNKKNGRQVSDR